jgi:DHA3 family tetracycline resistance protein-like MFS transporter
MAWQVLLLTGSGAAMAGVTIAGTVPRICFFLIGGVTADRVPRRLIMLLSDTARALIVLLIALLGWVHLLQVWHLYALALLFGVVDGFFSPAYQAIIPQVVEKEVLPSANALTGISQKVGFILGPVLAAGSITLLAIPASAFAFNGLTFIVSSLCLLAVRLPGPAHRDSPPTDAQQSSDQASGEGKSLSGKIFAGIRSVFSDAHEGFRYVLQSRWLRVAIPISALCNIAISGPSQVASPMLIHNVYGAGAWLLGVVIMANSLGSIVAMFLVGQLHLRRRGLFAYLALTSLSFVMVIFGLPLPHNWEPVVATLAAFTGGAGLGFFNITWITLLQEKVAGDKLGRVSSIDMLGSYALLPLGYALAGVFTDWLGASWVFIAGGLLNFVLCLVVLSVRDIRNL